MFCLSSPKFFCLGKLHDICSLHGCAHASSLCILCICIAAPMWFVGRAVWGVTAGQGGFLWADCVPPGSAARALPALSAGPARARACSSPPARAGPHAGQQFHTRASGKETPALTHRLVTRAALPARASRIPARARRLHARALFNTRAG